MMSNMSAPACDNPDCTCGPDCKCGENCTCGKK